jgi:hypothetical protein
MSVINGFTHWVIIVFASSDFNNWSLYCLHSGIDPVVLSNVTFSHVGKQVNPSLNGIFRINEKERETNKIVSNNKITY